MELLYTPRLCYCGQDMPTVVGVKAKPALLCRHSQFDNALVGNAVSCPTMLYKHQIGLTGKMDVAIDRSSWLDVSEVIAPALRQLASDDNKLEAHCATSITVYGVKMERGEQMVRSSDLRKRL
ncbi:hypothetical protein RRF57_002694 [Xylaria bambusicola]|uniref:Uncharacterized protein n=1 Tax=Xylaria bambusicola TaxID=326684 RepID=A0AAN7UDH9_9PEZI